MGKENPEYEKYYNIVIEFKNYIRNNDIVNPEGKKTMYSFMKYKYGLEGDAATCEMRKIENIIYGITVSEKPKRNRRREIRTKMFNEKFNI